MRLVDSPTIAFATLHNPRHGYAQLYAAPYALVYVAVLVAYSTLNLELEVSLALLALSVIGHALLFLSTHWSMAARVFITCHSETDPWKASFIRVQPIAHQGKADLAELFVEEVDKREQLWFSFQRRKFVYDADKKHFVRISYPVREPIETYRKSIGYTDDTSLTAATARWGLNTLDIPMPEFKELFLEHAVAPFFVFQLFCVLLWCLDEYWYFSIFTLLMLVAFESTVVFQRLRNVRELRKMSPKPYFVNIYRNKKWQQLLSDQLVPGDICSLVRSQEDRGVPCDLLLLQGSCIVNEAMLTGESVPQAKESIAELDDNEVLHAKTTHKPHIVFAGTKVVQSTPPEGDSKFTAPDRGAVCYVLRTGFETAQGKLVRTIIFSTERVTANNLESLFFILFLMIFAIAASYYVWTNGVRENRSRYKLLLDCILIVTSVIPPELPMELALAVNQSLIALSKLAIFCTEPFRIPLAGKVDICCFDKTGTLTTDTMQFEGIATARGKNPAALVPVDAVSDECINVLATCHSLAPLEDGTLVGDPMEKATLEAIGWTFSKSHVAMPSKGLKRRLTVLRRFPFSSTLKRMATVSRVDWHNDQADLIVSVKGAAEVLADRFVDLPAEYDGIQKHYARQGKRVLAIGYKVLKIAEQYGVPSMDRQEVESGLSFAGFLIFSSPLKPDAASSLRLLADSSHRLIMITGDSALTGLHVAGQVHIVEREARLLDVRPNTSPTSASKSDLIWIAPDTDVQSPFVGERAALENIFYNYDVCFTGPALAIWSTDVSLSAFKDFLVHVRVFARASPEQKEYVLLSFKQLGYHTLMCGDGTNDVGALKQAHIGVALLDGRPEDLKKLVGVQRKSPAQLQRELQARVATHGDAAARAPPKTWSEMWQRAKEEAEARQLARLQQQRGGAAAATAATAAIPAAAAAGAVATAAAQTPQQQQRRPANPKEAMAAAMDQMDDEVPIVKLGDASIAAPFTSKISHVQSITDIVRQGRSTLVTMVQMYKILALNCLITAYSLSVLYLDGIKFGDTQYTISGILMTICFLSLSSASPARHLSRQRPQPNIFNLYILLSVIGQFAVHVYCLISVSQLAKGLSPEPEVVVAVDEVREYSPSLLNNGIYIISLAMHVSTFAINYQGRPFREGITENKPLFYSLGGVFSLAVIAAGGFFEDMTWLELVPFPEEFSTKLLMYVLGDLVGSWLIEVVTAALFSNNKPRKELRLSEPKK